ncbi:hypothetical protein RN001_005071 [Aquatica leii]|uniref:Uncharacterized protein n=1 Tax=Aquatica leii TaxID=1421715 RepID=A0AAN7Q0Q1_9COLE|nr:hypothetical protein RN001_005071 [Aquatica leii]
MYTCLRAYHVNSTSPVQEEVEVVLESESLVVHAKPANTISTAVISTACETHHESEATQSKVPFCEESAPSTSGMPFLRSAKKRTLKTIQVTRQRV